MAFIGSDLVLIHAANGYNFWRYDTTDAHGTLDAAGYFNNADDDTIFQVGDILYVVVWNTVRTGVPSTYGTHICTEVTAAGAVDVTNVTVGVMTDSD